MLPSTRPVIVMRSQNRARSPERQPEEPEGYRETGGGHQTAFRHRARPMCVLITGSISAHEMWRSLLHSMLGSGTSATSRQVLVGKEFLMTVPYIASTREASS